MKFFATADPHGDPRHFELIKETCIEEKVDALFIAGDIAPACGGMNSIGEYEKAQTEWWNNQFAHFVYHYPILLFYVLGNDDWFHTHGFNSTTEHFGIYGPMNTKQANDVRYFPYVNPCAAINVYSNRERNNNEQEYHLNHLGDCKGKIILAHTPPFGICDLAKKYENPYGLPGAVIEVAGEHIGSKAAYKFIQEQHPAIWLCGHVHEGYGMEIIGGQKFEVGMRGDRFEEVSLVADGEPTYVFNCACDRDIMRGWIIEYEDGKVLDYKPVRKEH